MKGDQDIIRVAERRIFGKQQLTCEIHPQKDILWLECFNRSNLLWDVLKNWNWWRWWTCTSFYEYDWVCWYERHYDDTKKGAQEEYDVNDTETKPAVQSRNASLLQIYIFVKNRNLTLWTHASYISTRWKWNLTLNAESAQLQLRDGDLDLRVRVLIRS